MVRLHDLFRAANLAQQKTPAPDPVTHRKSSEDRRQRPLLVPAALAALRALKETNRLADGGVGIEHNKRVKAAHVGQRRRRS